MCIRDIRGEKRVWLIWQHCFFVSAVSLHTESVYSPRRTRCTEVYHFAVYKVLTSVVPKLERDSFLVYLLLLFCMVYAFFSFIFKYLAVFPSVVQISPRLALCSSFWQTIFNFLLMYIFHWSQVFEFLIFSATMHFLHLMRIWWILKMQMLILSKQKNYNGMDLSLIHI